MTEIYNVTDDSPQDWFEREVCFAIDAHEYSADLHEQAMAIVNGPGSEDEIYARAAQLIACTRNTCGGANGTHRHDPIGSDWREMVNDEAARHGTDPLHLDAFACPNCGSVAKIHWTGCGTIGA